MRSAATATAAAATVLDDAELRASVLPLFENASDSVCDAGAALPVHIVCDATGLSIDELRRRLLPMDIITWPANGQTPTHFVEVRMED